MKSIFVKAMCIGCVLTGALWASAEPYTSRNKICVVEKKENGYWFLNNKEFASKAEQVVGAQRNQFEWFFIDGEKIVARVYPALRDALILTPDDLYQQNVEQCLRTDVNLKAVNQVSYQYDSRDLVCACVMENNKLDCSINNNKLRTVPYENWALFFETGNFPSVIIGVVPPVLQKAWKDLPDDFMQSIRACDNNTTNEERAKQLEAFMRKIHS